MFPFCLQIFSIHLYDLFTYIGFYHYRVHVYYVSFSILCLIKMHRKDEREGTEGRWGREDESGREGKMRGGIKRVGRMKRIYRHRLSRIGLWGCFWLKRDGEIRPFPEGLTYFQDSLRNHFSPSDRQEVNGSCCHLILVQVCLKAELKLDKRCKMGRKWYYQSKKSELQKWRIIG